MSKPSYRTPYKIPITTFSYLIPAQELKCDVVEKKEEDDDTPLIGFSFFMSPSMNPKFSKPSKPETKTAITTGKEFSIFATPGFDIIVTIEGTESSVDKYKVCVDKTEKKTGVTDSFLCLISRDILNGILLF